MFFAWGWLRHDKLCAIDWMGLAALAIFTYKVPGSRGAFGGMAVMLLLFAVQKFFPKLFDNKILVRLCAGCAGDAGGVQPLRRDIYNPLSGPTTTWRFCC